MPPRGNPPRIGTLPEWSEVESASRSSAWLIRDGVAEGSFLEVDVGQGTALFMVGHMAPATPKGRWVESILVSSSEEHWSAWYDNRGGEDADSTGLFHACSRNACGAVSHRRDLSEVYMERVRFLWNAQVKELPFAREGLELLQAQLDGEELNASSVEESAALATIGSPGRRQISKGRPRVGAVAAGDTAL